MTIRFDNRVAIVTGAGGGLGRAHALELARRGAKVVVNDLGGARDGTGSALTAAEHVVAEIKAFGGDAIANGASVTDEAQVSAMVEEAMKHWGRVDILINNAGILRDKTFAKMTMDDFRAVIDVHLIGSAICTKAVWDIMRTQNYGRIVMTASSTGLYGNFGQSNYAAAKLGLMGLANTLHLEGQKNNIRVNTISPIAATRMTADLMPPEMLELMKPEYVTPAVLYLISEDAPSRITLAAGLGGVACVQIYETAGYFMPIDERTPEAVAAAWNKICDTAGQSTFEQGAEQTAKYLQASGLMSGR